MTEQRRPQSRMVPALTAALVGVLLGALVVVVGVLAGQRGGCCCCQSYGPVCGEAAWDSRAPAYPAPGRPITPWHAPIVPPWVRPELQRHDVPEPGTLMLVGLGALMVGRMAA